MYLKPNFYTAQKCEKKFKHHFFGSRTDKSKFELEKVVGKYMPQINLRLVFE